MSKFGLRLIIKSNFDIFNMLFISETSPSFFTVLSHLMLRRRHVCHKKLFLKLEENSFANFHSTWRTPECQSILLQKSWNLFCKIMYLYMSFRMDINKNLINISWAYDCKIILNHKQIRNVTCSIIAVGFTTSINMCPWCFICCGINIIMLSRFGYKCFNTHCCQACPCLNWYKVFLDIFRFEEIIVDDI